MTLALAFILDLFLGDPEHWPHPVRWIGRLIRFLEYFLRRIFSKNRERFAGILLVILTCGITFSLTLAIVRIAGLIHPLAVFFTQVFLIYTALSVKSLEFAARDVSGKLEISDLDSARKSVAKIVGRDTKNMSEEEVIRATVETVAENTVDGIISPLFFAMLGGAPLAMTFKAVSTLDSMVGYQNEKYKNFGWASARLDDLANWIPARVCYLLIPGAAWMTKGNMADSYRIAWRDGFKHPSPNSGIAEAAFAGALGVQLGGINFREGQPVEYPRLGDPGILRRGDIGRAIRLSFAASVIWMFLLSLMEGF